MLEELSLHDDDLMSALLEEQEVDIAQILRDHQASHVGSVNRSCSDGNGLQRQGCSGSSGTPLFVIFPLPLSVRNSPTTTASRLTRQVIIQRYF